MHSLVVAAVDVWLVMVMVYMSDLSHFRSVGIERLESLAY